MAFINARSATLATMAAIAVGSVTYLGTSFMTVLARGMMTYHALLLAFFTTLYYTAPGGFESHFNVPQLKNVSDKDQKARLNDVLYYSLVTHASVGYGDIYPLTREARWVVGSHILLSFMGVANLVLLTVKK